MKSWGEGAEPMGSKPRVYADQWRLTPTQKNVALGLYKKSGCGGARNIKPQQRNIVKYQQVINLLKKEPYIQIKDARARYNLAATTYYRLKERYASKKTA